MDGEWHEFESKALRRENEKKEKELRRAAQKEAAGGNARERDRKRPNESTDVPRESKRPHVDGDSKPRKTDKDAQPSRDTPQRLSQTSQLPVGVYSKPDQAPSGPAAAPASRPHGQP